MQTKRPFVSFELYFNSLYYQMLSICFWIEVHTIYGGDGWVRVDSTCIKINVVCTGSL